MHMRTKALVLRETAYKESDKILTLLTQEAGKLTASGRGCRKKGSPIAAGCQLLVWSDMVLYEHRGRWAVQEAAVEREFRGMRDDLVKLALGCYGAEVTELLAVEGVPNPELLSLLLNSLHALDKLDRPPALVKAAFELRCLCLAGYGPLLDACAVCGREPPEDPRFHLREGVLHCAACRGEVGDGISMPVDGGVLAVQDKLPALPASGVLLQVNVAALDLDAWQQRLGGLAKPAVGAQGDQQIEDDHRGRQHQGQGHDRPDRPAQPGARARQPPGDRGADQQQDQGSQRRQLERQPDGAQVAGVQWHQSS